MGDKHTPGPWEVLPTSLSYGVCDSDGDRIAEVWHEGNADLIAAAPELAEAWGEFLSAQDTIDCAEFMDNYTDAARARDRQARAIKKARNALVKARGTP